MQSVYFEQDRISEYVPQQFAMRTFRERIISVIQDRLLIQQSTFYFIFKYMSVFHIMNMSGARF